MYHEYCLVNNEYKDAIINYDGDYILTYGVNQIDSDGFTHITIHVILQKQWDKDLID